MQRREFNGKAIRKQKHMGFGRMPHSSTHASQRTDMVAGSKQAHPIDSVIDLEEVLQDLAYRASTGDKVAGQQLAEIYSEHDVEFNEQFDNPTNRTIDPSVQGFHATLNGFNRN